MTGTERQSVFDPLLHDIALTYSEALYPLGFRVTLASNSQAVIDAASDSWGHCANGFASGPLELRVVVQGEGCLSPPPVFRAQGHLLTVVGDAWNFGVADARSAFAYAFVSEQTAAEAAALCWHFLDPLVLTMLAQRGVAPLHASCVAYNGIGVLLCGPSGAGKSTLAFAASRAGWNYLADDSTWLLSDGCNTVALARPGYVRLRPEARRLFSELSAEPIRIRANGEPGIQIATRHRPDLRTMAQATVGSVVSLRRTPDAHRLPVRLESDELWNEITRDAVYASYGDAVNERHESVRRGLLRVPGYRLNYSDPDDAIEKLSYIARWHGGQSLA